MKKFYLTLLASFLAVGIFVSCSSVPKEIPENSSVEELKQRAYELTAKGNYAGAEKYYQTIISRYGMNAQVLISSEFEVAHLYIKQKKYNEAEPKLRHILNYYEVSDVNLPSQYKTLAELDLKKIEDHKIKHENKKSKNKKSKDDKTEN